jgi:hypothetical protein
MRQVPDMAMVEPVVGALLNRNLMRALNSIAILSSFVTGCVMQPGTGWGSDGDVDPSHNPPAPSADGTYQVHSSYDVTVNAVLPEPAYEVVGTLHDFSTAPAHTLLDLAEQAGVPAVGTIRAALPSSLETRLEGWIDDQIEAIEIGGVPVTQIAGDIAALAETVITKFSIDSELDVDGTTATHRLTKIGFGADTSLSLANLPTDLTTQTTTCSTRNTTLTIGEHTYGLPYGTYAWQALESKMNVSYGATPRAFLGQIVNCPAVATAVANKCLLGICVGHKTELTQICERGLDEVVAAAQRKVVSLRFDALHHTRGTATLVDSDHDGRADRLEGGVWVAEIDATQGLRQVPATFSAQR